MIVSAYFNIPSKKTHEFYQEHLRRFLGLVESPMVFFTSPDLYESLRAMRPSNFPIEFVFYDSVYEIEAMKKYGVDFWKGQCLIDTEKYHTPELSAIWYNKKEFVKRAMDMTKLDEPYIWADAGCIRYDVWKPFLPTFGRNTNIIPKDKLLLQVQNYPVNKRFFAFPDTYVAASIMAAWPETWQKLDSIYEETFNDYVKNGICVNSDQHILSACFVKDPSFFQLILDLNCPEPLRWNYFLKHLSLV
jgi:hypothetical protein